jgi:hypothetical protein
MGNTAGQGADALHLLRLEKLILKSLSLGHTAQKIGSLFGNAGFEFCVRLFLCSSERFGRSLPPSDVSRYLRSTDYASP